jgi:hypothetical protein
MRRTTFSAGAKVRRRPSFSSEYGLAGAGSSRAMTTGEFTRITSWATIRPGPPGIERMDTARKRQRIGSGSLSIWGDLLSRDATILTVGRLPVKWGANASAENGTITIDDQVRRKGTNPESREDAVGIRCVEATKAEPVR